MGFIESILGKFLGNKSDRDIKEIMPLINKIKAEYPRIEQMSHDQLRAETLLLKKQIAENAKPIEEKIAELKLQAESTEMDGREDIYTQIDKLNKELLENIESTLTEILPTAFSIVKETARRFKENDEIEVDATEFDRELATSKDFVEIRGQKAFFKSSWTAGGNVVKWDMVHYDVQLIGGVVLHQGKIAEMMTGEGKTLVATLPVFLNALAGRGVHIVTVNDYLSKRDSEWMGPIYMFHGLSVDCIDKHQPNSTERRNAYLADITFGTNNEFGFDYLRDNMTFRADELVQRKHHYAIVDEVDSVLIDDARTPLIISGPVAKSNEIQFEELRPKVEKLFITQRQMVTQLLAEAKTKMKSADSKEQEEGNLLLLRAYKGLPKYKPLNKYLSEQGIKAILHKTENYHMQDNNRLMHLATDPLFFVIDEKANSVDLTDKGIDLLTDDSDDANFFVLPNMGEKIADIEKDTTMTADQKIAAKDELLQDYAIKAERVHTINQLLKAYAMFEKDDQYVVIDNQVKIVDEQTGRIMEGRRYSDGLHQAIESKERVKVEAATQTMATVTLQNFFRMYHKLAGMTGTAETEAGELWDIYKLDVVVIPTNRPISRKDLQDKIYKTKREKYSAAIDEIVELVNLGRPVLVGTTSVEISELLSRMLKMKGITHNVLNAKLHQREAEIVAQAGKKGIVTIATNMAGRGTDIKLSDEVKAAGGLAIIGTERHESRRVDRQLRGRAGRQGDPGSSQFYVSLEDELMRLFGSERIMGIMDKLGLKEGEVIQHSMISKSIERAQKKVEENNFGIRKRLLEYDDVMNNQREVIYTKRRHALLGERMDIEITNMLYDVSESIVNEFITSRNFEGFQIDLFRFLSIEPAFNAEAFKTKPVDELIDKTFHKALITYQRKTQKMADVAHPVIADVFENKGHMYENILVPISDGKRVYNVATNLKEAYESGSQEVVKSFEKTILLLYIDEAWKEHLRELDELRQAVNNATYEQKDPLLIYKFESFNLFKKMLDDINKKVISSLMKGQIPTREPEQVREAVQPKSEMNKYRTQKDDSGGRSNVQSAGPSQSQGPINRPPMPPMPGQQRHEPIKAEKKIGRNDPCPCGSGKKFKQCHGSND